MAVARREQRARDIRVRVADKPPLQDFNRFFELTQLEVRLRLEVQVDARVVGIEGKNAVKYVKRPLCLAPVVRNGYNTNPNQAPCENPDGAHIYQLGRTTTNGSSNHRCLHIFARSLENRSTVNGWHSEDR